MNRIWDRGARIQTRCGLVSRRQIKFWSRVWLALMVGFFLLVAGGAAFADTSTSSGRTVEEPPRAALKYRRDLVRNAHQVWGLDAPVAVFAAQVHQESGWKPAAVSRVGAVGMTQFMPSTADWMRQTFPSLAGGEATNPVWALRALVTYDKWLYERVGGETEFDRLWAALRAYNGGLGHWQMEAASARPATDRIAIDAACGHARRSAKFCPENLGYPNRIMLVIQPRYLGWGRGVTL
jgi:soluble lytic murein transglycosylase-like protein